MSDLEAQSPTPPLHAEVRAKVLEYIEAAYLHGLPAENLDTGELEPPRDIADVEWIADRVLQAVADALLAGLPEKIKVPETLIELPPDNILEAFDKGYNEALDAVTRVISELKK